MVNSSWTENHILSLWNSPFKTHRVYPPCEVAHLKKLQHVSADDKIVIMSISQFRPEKDHPLQLQAMYELRTMLHDDEPMWNRVIKLMQQPIGLVSQFASIFSFQIKLLIVGSCRNEEDYERLKNMQDLSKHLSLENSVEFRVNISYQELIQCYQTASIGIHTMWNEHFGIGIVECMAAGLIMVANRWVLIMLRLRRYCRIIRDRLWNSVVSTMIYLTGRESFDRFICSIKGRWWRIDYCLLNETCLRRSLTDYLQVNIKCLIKAKKNVQPSNYSLHIIWKWNEITFELSALSRSLFFCCNFDVLLLLLLLQWFECCTTLADRYCILLLFVWFIPLLYPSL